MILNQREASIEAGISRQRVNVLSKQNPRPSYFIEITKPDGKSYWHIDNNHSEWKEFVRRKKKEREIEGLQEKYIEKKQSDEKFDRLIKAVVDESRERLKLSKKELGEYLAAVNKRFLER